MIELAVIAGNKAGTLLVARRFPFKIGRAPDAGLSLDDQGVFERHFEIRFRPKMGYELVASSEAWVLINGQAVQQARLRPGDIIDVGSAKVRFGLSAVPQRGLRTRECFTWGVVIALGVIQVALIYWLEGWIAGWE